MYFGQTLVGYLNDVLAKSQSPDKFKIVMNFLGISKAFCVLRYEKITEFSCDKQSQGRLNDNWLLRNAKNLFRRWQ